jgi:lysozyme family protein
MGRINNFKKALKFVLKWEGGYSNDPNDPGGETKYGVSKRSYPELDISKLSLKQAEEIYHQNYWLKAGCDELPYPFNIIVFDTAVNLGRRRALEFLSAYNDWRDYLLRRIEFYTKCKGAKIYIRGWMNRTIDLYRLVRGGE